MLEKAPCVYMLASKPNGTLYTGVTSDLCGRVSRHKQNLAQGFSKRYRVKTLVWFEQHGTMEGAIMREKRIKAWKRHWKVRLIMESNPGWRDLFEDICGQL